MVDYLSSELKGFLNILKKYPTQIPRYTSYPTAPLFGKLDSETYYKSLASCDLDKDISIYIHIPFCRKLCWFCGCNTKITNHYPPVHKYLKLLIKEIELFNKQVGKKVKVSHVHFGGGSPTILEPDDFSKLMSIIRENFTLTLDAQIALEVDPRSVNEAKIASYSKAGVNRVSLGIQDFSHDVQVAINRIQPFSLVYKTVELFRSYNISQINFDLIYGLPQQTTKNIVKNIELSLTMKPNRLALFGYAYVPWKKKNMLLIDPKILPNEDLRFALYNIAAKTITDNGYISVGIDHFALPEDNMIVARNNHQLKRNFQGYTVDESNNLVGFGVSSITSLDNGYFQNVTNNVDYHKFIKTGNLPIAKGILLSEEDKLRGKIIEEIMCYLTCDISRIILPNIYEIHSNLKLLEKDQLISFNNEIIIINPKIPQVARIVCSLFDAYYEQENESKHSKV